MSGRISKITKIKKMEIANNDIKEIVNDIHESKFTILVLFCSSITKNTD